MSTSLQKLLAAKRSYFEGGAAATGLTDAEYDQLEAAVRREHPEAAEEIDATGWTPEDAAGAIRLPYLMPSLDKGKPGEELLAKFLSGPGAAAIIASEKLDGISALWDAATGRLYNRGDGVLGTDLTAFVPRIKGLLPAASGQPRLIRGEIMLRKADANPDTPSRSQVNGCLHRAAGGQLDLPLRFVAYQICDPPAVRLQHFKLLATAGYEVPWWQVIKGATEEGLAALLAERKTASPYDIDGLVIGKAMMKPADPELRDGRAVKPKDCIAFKMPLEEQQARTRVVAIEWNCSRFNVYAPRIQIEPVRIGGALITYVTGHNAKFMVENGLGVGAEVTVLRSGDVIPIIYKVHKAVAPVLPSTTWDATHTNVLATTGSTEQQARHLENALAVLGVDGMGPAAARALVDAEIVTIQDILDMPVTTLVPILGQSKGVQLAERLRAAVAGAPLQKLILASQDIPKGMGNTKLAKVIQAYPNCGSWSAELKPPASWSVATWEEFCDVWPTIRGEIEGWKKAVGLAAAIAVPAAAAAPAIPPTKGGVCMSGFRDAALAAAAAAAGYSADDTVKKTTCILVIPDREDPQTISTGKAVKAREIGARILRASEWKSYLEKK
jgi:NAD-dependent DNA ligase